MYMASWNAKGYTKIYTQMNSVGYFVGNNEKPTTYSMEYQMNKKKMIHYIRLIIKSFQLIG